MIVLDASAAMDLLLGLPPHAEAIAARVAREAPHLAAPHLVDVEVAQAFRRWVRGGRLGPDRAIEALEDLASLPLERYPHGPLLRRAFEFQENLTIYDGVYLALAEALEATLLTCDAALENVPGARAAVERFG